MSGHLMCGYNRSCMYVYDSGHWELFVLLCQKTFDIGLS